MINIILEALKKLFDIYNFFIGLYEKSIICSTSRDCNEILHISLLILFFVKF